MSARFRIEELNPQHNRSGFDCGSEPLNSYLEHQVAQVVRRRITECFVAVEPGSEFLAGYYTLASAGVFLLDLPLEIAKRLPRYPSVPAVRMGRLAVALKFAGQGLGGVLLADAMMRALRSEIPAFALIVDAKDETAAAFYRHHGFIAFRGNPLALFLPLATAQRLLKR